MKFSANQGTKRSNERQWFCSPQPIARLVVANYRHVSLALNKKLLKYWFADNLRFVITSLWNYSTIQKQLLAYHELVTCFRSVVSPFKLPARLPDEHFFSESCLMPHAASEHPLSLIILRANKKLLTEILNLSQAYHFVKCHPTKHFTTAHTCESTYKPLINVKAPINRS